MERMLLLWDEWDDFTGVCSHLVASAADELTGLSSSVATTVYTVGLWVLAALSIR
jgi:hypothetical protein